MGASSDGSMGMGMSSDPAMQGDNIDAGGGWNPGSNNLNPNGNPNLTDKQQMILKLMGQQLAQVGKGNQVNPGSAMSSPFQNNGPSTQTMMGGQQISGNPIQR